MVNNLPSMFIGIKESKFGKKYMNSSNMSRTGVRGATKICGMREVICVSTWICICTRYVYVHVYFICEHVITSINKALSQSLWYSGNSCKNITFNTRGRWHQKEGEIEGMMKRKFAENYRVCADIPKQECASCPAKWSPLFKPCYSRLVSRLPIWECTPATLCETTAPWTQLDISRLL